jgi:hypothetical protein
VIWRGSFGMDVPRSARVEGISRTSREDPKGQCAERLPAIAWAEVQGRAVVVSLSNGHWAYGEQIKPATWVAEGGPWVVIHCGACGASYDQLRRHGAAWPPYCCGACGSNRIRVIS